MKTEDLIENCRRHVLVSIESLRFGTALGWAEKAVTASSGQVEDVYMLAKCMYFCKQYHRAAHLLSKLQLDEKYLSCKLLAAECYHNAQLHSEALQLLEKDHMWTSMEQLQTSNNKLAETHLVNKNHILSALYLLRGKVHEAMDNRTPAIEDYKLALKFDVHCSEAFELLIKHDMLTPEEEHDLLAHLPLEEQCTTYEEETSLIRAIYADKIRKYSRPEERAPAQELGILQNNLSVKVNHAQRLLNGCDYRGCFNLVKEVIKADPHHQACLPIYINCLVALKKPQVLFTLSHRLVDADPDNAVSWYSVGCYYYVIGRFEESRKFLHKATMLDRNLGTAWLMRGHAFAAENEHDQAMAAYFKASQLMRGSHLPMLYVGLEHGLMGNSRLANSFFEQAHSLAPDDPFVLHELGSVAYQNGDWQVAEKHFLQAVDLVSALTPAAGAHNYTLDDTWEPLLNNLGHVSRKLKKYEQAIDFHQKALLVSPKKASTYSAMAYVYALTFKYELAIEFFEKALALKRDDTFSTTMLNTVLEAFINESPPFLGAPKDVPPPVHDISIPATPGHIMVTPSIGHRQMASTSNMEVSAISMPDISEEELPQMETPGLDTPGFYTNTRQDDSVLSGIGPLHTPSDSQVTPVTSGISSGFRVGELGRPGRGALHRPALRHGLDPADDDTPTIIQRR